MEVTDNDKHSSYSTGPVSVSMGETMSLQHDAECHYAECRVATVMNWSNPLSHPWQYTVHDEFDGMVVL